MLFSWTQLIVFQRSVKVMENFRNPDRRLTKHNLQEIKINTIELITKIQEINKTI